MSFTDKVRSFFNRNGDKIKDTASKVDTDAAKEKATEVVDKVKDTASGDKYPTTKPPQHHAAGALLWAKPPPCARLHRGRTRRCVPQRPPAPGCVR